MLEFVYGIASLEIRLPKFPAAFAAFPGYRSGSEVP